MDETTKKLRGVVLAGAVVAVAVAAGAPAGRAQEAGRAARPSADEVGAWVQRFYDQTRSLDTRFTQRYSNRVYRRTDVSRGRLRIRRPGRMRFDYDRPNGKVIAANGTRMMVYEPGDGGGPGQYFDQPMSDSELPSALSFLTSDGRLADDFRFRLLDARRYRFAQGYVLELRPRRRSPHFTRLLFYVDGRAQTRGVVHRVVIVDHSNNRNRFDFSHQQLNRRVPDSVFAFRPPRGARRIQP